MYCTDQVWILTLYRVLEARRGILAPWLIPGNVVVEYLDARYLSEPGVNVAFVSSGLKNFLLLARLT